MFRVLIKNTIKEKLNSPHLHDLNNKNDKEFNM